MWNNLINFLYAIGNLSEYASTKTLTILIEFLKKCKHKYKRAAALHRRRFPLKQFQIHAEMSQIKTGTGNRNFLQQRRKYNENGYTVFLQFLAIVDLNLYAMEIPK